MTTVDLAAFDQLISTLRESGYDGSADQLDEAVHRTAYTTSSEMIGEISISVKAAAHTAGEHPPQDLENALQAARHEIIKVWPEFKLSGEP